MYKLIKTKKLDILVILSFIFFQACKAPSDKEKLEKLKKQYKELAKEITEIESKLKDTSTSKISKLKEIIVDTVTTSDFYSYFDVQGILESENNVLVNPKMGGFITSVKVTEGQQVSAGQVLATVDNSVLVTSLAEIENQLSLATIVFEKQSRLWEQKIGTEIQYLTAKNNKDALEKRMRTTKSQIAMSNIVAPFSGIVDEVLIKVGETAMPGMGGIRVVNMNNLKVVAKISDTYAKSIKKGDKVKVKINELDKEFDAVISFASLQVSLASRTFLVEIKIPQNIKDLRPNLNATISINDKTVKNGLVIPVNIIQTNENGEATVMLINNKNNQFITENRIIKTSHSYGGKTLVNEGLTVGDIYIKEGFEDVLDNQNVKLKN